jgi:hypothetical protein
MAGALGQMCIFYTIANFGALTCSLITTLRKMMQIGQCGKERALSLSATHAWLMTWLVTWLVRAGLSALAFGHTFTPMQLVGVASSFTGVYVMQQSRSDDAPLCLAAIPLARPSVLCCFG